MKLHHVVPLAAAILTACADDPVQPGKDSQTPPRQAAAVYIPAASFAYGGFHNGGIDPTARYVAGYLDVNGNKQPAVWVVPFDNALSLAGLGGGAAGPGTSWGMFFVNSNAIITTSYSTVSGNCSAYYWRGGVRHTLTPQAGEGCFTPKAISDGTAFTIVGNTDAFHAYRFDVTEDDQITGRVLPFPTGFTGALCWGEATGVNSTSGFITGSYNTPCAARTENFHVVSWSLADNSVTDWGIEGRPTAVNSSGTVVGNEPNGARSQGAFISTGPGDRTLVQGNVKFWALNDQGAAIAQQDGYSVVYKAGAFSNAIDNTRFVSISKRGTLVGEHTGYIDNFWGTLLYNTQKDTDRDGLPDVLDNCPRRANVDQVDSDGDGTGDVCDPDMPIHLVATVNKTTAGEGRPFTFNLIGTYDPGGRPLYIDWAFSDGNDGTNASAFRISKSFAERGAQTATVTVTTGVDTATYTFDLMVIDVAPYVSVDGYQINGGSFIPGAPGGLTFGSSIDMDVGVSDLGPHDIVGFTIDWGDGTPLETHTCFASVCVRGVFHRYNTTPLRPVSRIQIIATDNVLPTPATRKLNVPFVVH